MGIETEIVTLDESKFPNIYAFAYILNHGEEQESGWKLECYIPYTIKHLEQVEKKLETIGFGEVVRFATLCMEETSSVHGIYHELGELVFGFPGEIGQMEIKG